nr:branched-chain amino acid ABC transporter permease [Salinibaculum sp. KK48]
MPATQAFLPQISTGIFILYFGLFAISFDFISGYTGYLSFGHAAFYGAGGYFVVLAGNGKLPLVGPETPYVFLILGAAVVALLLSVAIGLLSFRLTGVYFAMITLGFGQVLYVVSESWRWLGSSPSEGLETGANFVFGVPYTDLGLELGFYGSEVEILNIYNNPEFVAFYVIGFVVLICYLAMQRMIHSPFGRAMIAIRENEERARAIGYNTLVYKLGAFMISAFFAGVAGALWAGYQNGVSPDEGFYFLVTGNALLASIIGGLGTLVGPLYGWIFTESVDEFLAPESQGGGLQALLEGVLPESGVQILEAVMTGHAGLYLGIIFVVFVLFVPGGLIGSIRARVGNTSIAKAVSQRIEQLR